MNFFNTHFSHVYLEQGVENYPDTPLLLNRFPKAEKIAIKDYKHIFNRPSQDFQFQKNSIKLILAVKKENFLYEGSNQTPSFGHAHFYYNSVILNCVYNCDYCYLQGMYNSANIVMFVNSQEFFDAVDEKLNNHPVYLCISYDTDLLAFENILPHCSRWIEFARTRPGLTIEIRTKSANYKSIGELKPHDGVILAWSLSPAPIAEKYEKGAAPIHSRINSITNAVSAGWRVRLCFDPVLKVGDWEKTYSEFFRSTFESLDASKVFDISLGAFRMNRDYLSRIRAMREDSDILYYPFSIDDQSVGYEDAAEMMKFCKSEIEKYVSSEKVNL